MSTWVLLRGLARGARHWGRFPDLLRRRLPAGHEVLTPDLPGNGVHWRTESPSRIDGYVDALRSELRGAGHRPPYVLLALSLGGMVAVQWAARYPRELRACVLVNSSLGGYSAWWQRLQPAALAGLVIQLVPGGDAFARERRILRLTSNLPLDAETVSEWAAHARVAPISTGNMLRQLLAAARHRAPDRAPDVPVLLLASRGDRIASVRCSRAIAAAWQAPLREHPNAGHDLPLDAPDWLVEQVTLWYLLRP